jgi:predicted CXXCH cytochrome family protein
MTCMTCHEAHAPAVDDYDMARTIFLRFPGPGGRICRICHGTMEGEGNSHFMGRMDRTPPEILVRLGAAPSFGIGSRLDCRTCHLPHGRRERYLLVGGKRAACAWCHEQADHGSEPHAKSGRFLCRDCHSSHGGRGPSLLGEKPGGAAAACSPCHRAMDGVNDSPHNPARPREACLSCHAPFAPPGEAPFLWGLASGPGATRIERRCRACHAPDDSRSAKPVPVSGHPGGAVPVEAERDGPGSLEPISCGTCHDVHGSGPAMLHPGIVEKVCAACHGPEGLWLMLNYHQERRGAMGR